MPTRVPACFDRTGSVVEICHPDAMASHLTAAGVRLFDYANWAAPLREVVRENAEAITKDNDISIEFISRSKERRKED